MEGLGMLHGKLDTKILVLFILRRLPDKVDASELANLALSDGAVGYFEYAECLAELVDSDHVAEEHGTYIITEKGIRNCDIVESSLPYTIRTKLLKRVTPFAEQMRRRAMIKAEHSMGEDGCQVELGMSDGISSVIEMRLLCGDEKTAGIIEQKFRDGAEKYYNRIMEMFLNDEGAL